ncbi:hypothetical protein PYCCODRAFT_506477 [Trametes coccinea BRFM310]|uniref:Uncharacterized protein n=1 Tax=Trametes coccinea (strain BRFM310) TaxID=1353009 RepID=A0A1Y2IJP3_TRAC3|nr:hypothetical protein PYCCODRAFT_506477 [Trametes coccinea BRFM310]
MPSSVLDIYRCDSGAPALSNRVARRRPAWCSWGNETTHASDTPCSSECLKGVPAIDGGGRPMNRDLEIGSSSRQESNLPLVHSYELLRLLLKVDLIIVLNLLMLLWVCTQR